MSKNNKNIKGKFAEGFNTQLVNFFKELILMYPDNKDFKTFKHQIMVTSETPAYELLIQTYEIHIKPYRDHLRSKNEKFFLEFDLSGTPLAYLDYLKPIWINATPTTKQSMWKYFIIFDKLSEKYNSI